ncbi:hypothetical protein [uncultured Jatrophihabitans sp.]|uniref:hypothetical protein n=1 Tax=uncultured Jatrophihabitans sp. TaxID=1610747 RepID=UPI0035C97817
MRKITKVLVAVGVSAAVATGAAACSSSGGDKKPVATLKTVTGNTTAVKLDAGFVSALTTLKLTPGITGTAKLDAATGTVSFPITGGHVTVYKKGAVNPYVQGELDHNGSGLTLTAGATKVTLQNFVVDPGKNSKLTGEVLLNGKTAAPAGTTLFDLDGSTLKPITITNGVADLTGTRVLLNSGAAKLLDTAFKTTAVKGGLLIGVATIMATGS